MDIQQLGAKLDEVLHRFVTRDEDNGANGDTSGLLSDVQSLKQVVEAAVAAGQEGCGALPVKSLEELRVLGSACWNMTVRHTAKQDDVEEQKLRASLRDFATRAFLLGNYAYSAKDVSHGYFTHHPREAEQCLLMCLKTSRDLSLCGMADSARGLLAVGEAVASHIRPGVKKSLTHLKHRNMTWELAYTTMDVMWNIGEYQASCQASQRLSEMLLKDDSLKRDHREAFFRFVFRIGNNSLPMNAEEYVRNMLLRSIDVQNYFKESGASDAPHHLTMLRGATMEQLALSCLREGNAAEAAHWAKEADAALHTSSSALLRLKTSAEAGMEAEAGVLLHEYVQRSDVSADDAVAACFELQNLLVNAKESSIEGMRLLLQRVKGTASRESVAFRLVQLLLRDGCLSSCQAALQILQKESIDFEEAKYRRYCFIWLWELSDTAEFTRTQAVESLEVALRLKDCASDSEIDAVHLRLCSEYIAVYEDDQEVGALENAKRILLKFKERKSRCPFFRCLLFKVAVLESNEAELEQELQCLLTCEPAEMVMPALCTGINYCLKRGYLHGVSLAARHAFFSSASISDVRVELELSRVYVASVLSKACNCTDEHLCAVAERLQRLLSDKCAAVSLTHEEVMWWVQVFLVLGSEFTDGPGPTSVLLFRVATLIALQDPVPSDGPSHSLLLAGLLCSMEDEFQLFAAGRPQMDPHDLDERLRLCREVLSTTPDVECRVTLLLAEAEYHLRSPSPETPKRIEAILEELSGVPAAFEDYEDLADGAAFVASQCEVGHPPLHEVAMKLNMWAAVAVMDAVSSFSSSSELGGEGDRSCADYITDVLSCLYKSFTLASDRTEELVVVQRLLEWLSSSIGSFTVACFFKRSHVDGVRTVASHSMAFAVLFLEYFAVEAWNNSVFYLHLTDTAKQTEWARTAWNLVDTLPETSNVASALLALKVLRSF
ncbi:hypothetical protein DQ04_03441040 [Trypanosoma grayi]|uniref:hypothetical protein n=1 Tax=Trypanosoma grayi TaxID=71804 RepID=UPI0004F46F67|nr:hypothetical protein DQ04_03441040 [Trypanosoma grayi]KEG10667.1 hypothetical protein DQ04_03441040 [Trypanosoma grayi]